MNTRHIAKLLIVAFAASLMSGGTSVFGQKARTIKVTSPAFRNGQMIPAKYAYISEAISGSENVSIPLEWKVSPTDATKIKSIAVSIIDLHKVARKWVHLLAINLPPEARSVEEGAFSGIASADAQLLLNSYGAVGYGGPNPPAGTGKHVYEITVYGLKEMLNVDPAKQFTEKSFKKFINGKIVAKGRLRGKFASVKTQKITAVTLNQLQGIWILEKQLNQEGTEFRPVSEGEIIGGKVYYEFKNNTVCIEGQIKSDGTPGACGTYYPYSIAGNNLELDVSGTINKIKADKVNDKLELTLSADSGAAVKFVFNKWQGLTSTDGITQGSTPPVTLGQPQPCKEENILGFIKPRLLAGMMPSEGPVPLSCTNLEEALKEPLRVISLDLSNNGLAELSPDIGKLVKLQDLNLSGNQLTSLPSEIANLQVLYRLDISSNKFATFPSAVTQLASLNNLSAAYNQFSSLPAEFSKLTNLEFLFISDNKFAELPAPLQDLTKLRNLNISYNQIAALPAWLSKLASLQTFNLSYNKFAKVTPEVGALQTLWTLEVAGNPLVDGEEARIKAALPNLNRLNDTFLK